MAELTASAFRKSEPVAELVVLDATPQPTTPTEDESAALGTDLAPLPEAVRIPLSLRPFVPTAEFRPAKLNSRTELMALLNGQLPKNDYGLPLIIYRPDLLDYNQFNTVEESQASVTALQEHLDNAQIPLTYYEGYPALPDGSPFWAVFEFESREDHDVFDRYLNLPGARQLSLLVQPAVPLTLLQELYHCYCWGLRAQASDQFAVAHMQRLREQRVLKTEDAQFQQTQVLINKVNEQISSIDWKVLAGDPEKLVKTLERLYEMQRKAIRATGAKDDESRLAQPTELIMRKLTAIQKTDVNGNELAIEDQGLGIGEILRAAGGAQEVSQLQELVLRIGAQKPI